VARSAGRLLLAAAAAALLSAPAVATAAIPVPSADPFYTPPAPLASYAPGTVLRSRTVSVVGLTQLASGSAYELLYRTTDAAGQPIATVTTLLLPSHPASGPRRLLSYQTAEDSLTTKCAPSYTLRSASGTTQTAESAEMAIGLLKGWDVAVPDYQGPQSEWAVGPLGGHATLDGIRAVESFAAAGLDGARTEVATMGYSGGSIPTIWASAIAPSYAPALNIVGDAAGGIVPDPIENLTAVNGTVFAGAIVGVSVAVDRAYPSLGLGSLLNARGKALAAQDGADAAGCAGAVTNAPFGTVGDFTAYKTPQALEALPQVKDAYAHLDLIDGPVPKAPSYWYNEIGDELAIIKPVDELYAADCGHGAVIDYHRDPIGEHLTGSVTYVLPSYAYLSDRFAGKPAPDTCPPGSQKPAPTPAATCASPSGRLEGSRLGPIALGETRARARSTLRRVSGGAHADVFCFTGGAIRVGYRRGRVVLALTANRHYELGGARPGARLTARVRRRLRTGAGLRIGHSTWYLTGGRGLLEVRRGAIEAIGIAKRTTTSGRARARRLLSGHAQPLAGFRHLLRRGP
jgi:hypothetical protein